MFFCLVVRGVGVSLPTPLMVRPLEKHFFYVCLPVLDRIIQITAKHPLGYCMYVFVNCRKSSAVVTTIYNIYKCTYIVHYFMYYDCIGLQYINRIMYYTNN